MLIPRSGPGQSHAIENDAAAPLLASSSQVSDRRHWNYGRERPKDSFPINAAKTGQKLNADITSGPLAFVLPALSDQSIDVRPRETTQ